MAVPEDTLLVRAKRKLENNPIIVGLILLGLVSVPLMSGLQVYFASRPQSAPGVSAAPPSPAPAGPAEAAPSRNEPVAAPRDLATTPSRPAENSAVREPYDAGDPSLDPAPEPPDTFAIPDGQPRDRTIQPAYPLQ